ncbi:hypothetical protein [uncultured Selenomonas sp.]|uniref:hypothetical protein n=1 Tax=uncultured Selenomonas sp. TaxID=159275 RepID=UPI0028EDFCCF|nr:hypothetical protein [uncultured Selenomonas sp.]
MNSITTQMHLQRTAMPFGKDTFYRFMNSCRIHWRRFTTELAAAIIHATLAQSGGAVLPICG